MRDVLRHARYRRLKELREAISGRILNINASGSINVLNEYILGLAPVVVVRLHTRAVSSLINYYFVLTVEEVFARISRAVIKEFIAVKKPGYLNELSNIDRSLAIVESRLPNYLLGIVIGYHGAEPSSTRLLSPLDDIEVDMVRARTLEIEVDYFFKPVKNVRKITRRIRHTKFYTYRLKP